jgi:hypothetical protein
LVDLYPILAVAQQPATQPCPALRRRACPSRARLDAGRKETSVAVTDRRNAAKEVESGWATA